MNYSIDNLFPTPIFNSFIDPINDETKKEIFNLDLQRDGYGCILTVNSYVLEMDKFAHLKKQILDKVEVFAREVLFVDPVIEFYLLNSWFIIHEENISAYLHSHVNSILSGVLYVETDEKSGDIIFEKPYMYNNLFPYSYDFKFTKINEINGKLWKYTPKNNQILIFPSHLKHKVAPNLSKIIRVALGFNVMVRGDFSNGYLNEYVIK